MAGPPPAVLLVGYAAVGGLGFALTMGARENGDISFQGADAGAAPSDAGKLKAGIEAADAWRVAANAEYDVQKLAASKRAAEAKWYADYQDMLRNREALKAQVARSAGEQVERNKAVSGHGSQEAAEQGLAAPAPKRGLRARLSSIFGAFRKKK